MATWIVLLLLSLCFGLLVQQYYLAAKAGANSLAPAAAKRDLKLLNDRHGAGLITMATGAGCYLLLPLAHTHWLLPRLHADYAAVTGVLVGAVLALSCQQGLQKKSSIAHSYSNREGGRYLLLRAAFLLVYEVFFRVALLGAALLFLPAPAAVFLNVVLYVWAHLFSPPREALLSIPFGCLLCWLTLVHQSVWPAAVLHGLLSLPYEAFLIIHRKKQIQAYAS